MANDFILKTPSPEVLALAVQENRYELFRVMAKLPGSHLVETEKLSYHLTFPANPIYKGVWRTRLAPEETDDAIEEMIAWFKSQNAPFFFWWTDPATTPTNLEEYLLAHGLLSMEQQRQYLASGLKSSVLGPPGMVADLHHMNETVLDDTPANFTVEEIKDSAGFADFQRVLMESFQMVESAAHAWVEAIETFGFDNPPWASYLGRLDGEPVATTIIFKGAGVAGVNAVAAVPAVRGKGIGGAMTLLPLLEARAQGYHHAVLMSSEMGIRSYQRIGFRLVDVTLNRFLWRNT